MAFYNQLDDRTNFVISWTRQPREDFGIFAKAYTLAAERLATLLLEAPRFSDYEAYPVVFLYRHALELSLKHVIYSGVRLAACRCIDDVNDRLHITHDLRVLARTAGASLSLLFPEDASLRRITLLVEETCSEVSELDPGSFGYRYPIDKEGQPSTETNQLVNLMAFANRVSQVLDHLDTIHFGLNIETDIAEDALYETVRANLYGGAHGGRL